MPSLFAEAIGIAAAKGGYPALAIDAYDNLPSTSAWLSSVLRGAPDDTPVTLPRLCAVDLQTAGTGRRGKPWISERGNITFSIASVVERPGTELMGLSLMTGVCIAQVLSTLCGIRLALKWPNDLLVGDAKLGGVLIELLPMANSRHTRVITGIGINYRQRKFLHQDGLEGITLESLSPELPPRAQLIGHLAAHVLDGQTRFAADGWDPFDAAWRHLDYLRDRELSVIRGGHTQPGRARGVDGNGALLVEVDGRIEPLYSGDVSVRRTR